jgi:2-polyprenyl-3-methyl-5-hydroxy-6-metoxy-1,4-benzoquinol methylase
MTNVSAERPRPGYVFDNNSTHAVDHHHALADLWDDFTRSRITDLLDLSGAHCLEVAAGAGSIATWLAEQVGPAGHVTATDIKPQHIPAHPCLSVRQHDITSGEPLGEGYHLIHVRSLLNHLTQRRHVLHRLVRALRPGGVILTEDMFPLAPQDLVAAAPDPQDVAAIMRYHELHLRVLAERGNDHTWSRQALTEMINHGLSNTHAVVRSRSWQGGNPGCRFLAAALAQLRPEIIAAGMPSAQIEHVRRLFEDPRVVLHGFLMYSTSGRRPTTEESAP